jgi:DNA end-binding protein Ku
MVNIPVSLYTTTQTTRVARKEFTADGHAVGRTQFDKETGEVVSRDEVVKMAEATDGTLVPLTDDEITAVTGSDDGSAPIIATISINEFTRDYATDKLYQIRPKAEKKGGAQIERAFSLLMQTLALRNEVAIISIAMRRSTARFAAITPNGYMHVLHFEDAVRQDRPMPTVELSADELDLANKLVASISDRVPALVDESSEKIQNFVDAKAAGSDSAPETSTPEPSVGDLAEMLAASLSS